MCTSFRIKPQDGSVIVGRTMEFGADLGSRILVFPRNYSFHAAAPNNKSGLSWTGKYGFVALNGFGQEVATDGINEKGLYFGALYLPGFSKYQEVAEGKEAESISQMFDVGKYILSSASTIDEAKALLEKAIVWGTTLPPMTSIMGLHYAIHDQSGKCIVVEYIDGNMNVHDNPLGVLTNSPPFDWHLLNLRNYVNLTATNVPELKLTGDTVLPIGQGSGMLGLPGDFTPPSRFVRAVALTQAAFPPEGSEKGAELAFHILGSFDIPTGLVRAEENGKTAYELTQWMSVSDLKNLKYYVRYYNNPQVLMVDLTKIDFTNIKVNYLKTEDISWITDVSTRM